MTESSRSPSFSASCSFSQDSLTCYALAFTDVSCPFFRRLSRNTSSSSTTSTLFVRRRPCQCTYGTVTVPQHRLSGLSAGTAGTSQPACPAPQCGGTLALHILPFLVCPIPVRCQLFTEFCNEFLTWLNISKKIYIFVLI
jgi:hypothetical protein